MRNKHSALVAAIAIAFAATFSLTAGTAATEAAPTAREASLMAALQKAHPTTKFTSVTVSPVPGLFEVWMGANVAFVAAADPRHFIFGRIVDTATMTDITGPKLAQAERERSGADGNASGDVKTDVRTLPLADALKAVRGNGARKLYVFSDPGCGYCRKLEAELVKLNDTTIFTFVVPFQGRQLPQAVLCASDPAKAWQALMLNGDSSALASIPGANPASKTDCDSAVDRNLQLARQWGVSGTPTLIYADGTRTSGVVDAVEVERRVAATTATAGPKVSARTKPGQEKSP